MMLKASTGSLLILLSAVTLDAFAPTTTKTSSHKTATTPTKSNHNQKDARCWSFSLALRMSSDTAGTTPTMEALEDAKTALVNTCSRTPKTSKMEITTLVDELESLGERLGIGQASSISGLLNGEWELLYSPEDETRSSPFFWAFRKAFPDNADQIYGITDAIPAPLREIGPAFQVIDFNPASQSGRFISRVKVATLGGMATSIMTTRAAIVGLDGVDGIRLKIETTKPEESTIVKTFLGPLSDVVNENTPAFPSGQALERVRPGSSEVVLRTTYCDEGLRISRDGDRSSDIYVWGRREFASFDFL